MDVVVFLMGAFALGAGISKLSGAKTSWPRPARDSRWVFREPEWMRKASGAFLILFAVICFIGSARAGQVER